ncbi:Phosphopantetheine attachment site [Butyrivibrio sp. TB]|nr:MULTISPECIES: acyl carrier protein [Butyrivibrio]SEQ37121.1 Phosphopantetheine attachment site [Butyrivibrio sp. TB]
MMDENFIEVLSGVKEDVDFENETALIDDGILDSFDILQIISALNDEYDISIPASEIIPDNFNSAESLWAMVERLQNED